MKNRMNGKKCEINNENKKRRERKLNRRDKRKGEREIHFNSNTPF